MEMKNREIYIDEISLIRSEGLFKAVLCCCYFSSKFDYDSIIEHLNAHERSYFDTLQYEKRIRSFLIGRFTAKQAVAALTGENRVASITIQSGVFTQPIVVPNNRNIQVSITHCDNFGAALAFPDVHPMGIDIERISLHKQNVLEQQLTATEIKKIKSLTISYDFGLTLLWTVKEALSKVLKTGLMTPFEVYEISEIELHDNYITCKYKNFAQYRAMSFYTGNYVCSIVMPHKTQLMFDIQRFKAKFAFSKYLEDEQIVTG